MKIPSIYNISDVEAFFSNEGLSSFEYDYSIFHKKRYLYLLNVVAVLRGMVGEVPTKVLDVGPKCQTNLLRSTFDHLQVNSLGHQWPHNNMTSAEYHISVDLNKTEAVDVSKYEKNHIVIFAEVVEHLYTKPEIILRYLGQLMHPRAYMVIQTPNAVALDRRMKMLMGKNPFDFIEVHRQNHYREYTLSELKNIVEDSGFEVRHTSITNYFNPNDTLGQKMYNKFNPLIPAGLRSGITMIIQKNASQGEPDQGFHPGEKR